MLRAKNDATAFQRPVSSVTPDIFRSESRAISISAGRASSRTRAAICCLPEYKSVINTLVVLSPFFPFDNGFERAGLVNAKHGSGSG